MEDTIKTRECFDELSFALEVERFIEERIKQKKERAKDNINFSNLFNTYFTVHNETIIIYLRKRFNAYDYYGDINIEFLQNYVSNCLWRFYQSRQITGYRYQVDLVMSDAENFGGSPNYAERVLTKFYTREDLLSTEYCTEQVMTLGDFFAKTFCVQVKFEFGIDANNLDDDTQTQGEGVKACYA